MSARKLERRKQGDQGLAAQGCRVGLLVKPTTFEACFPVRPMVYMPQNDVTCSTV